MEFCVRAGVSMGSDLLPDDSKKLGILLRLASKMNLSNDEMIALYLVAGDSVFFLFDLLQDRLVKFPSMRGFRNAVRFSKTHEAVRLSGKHYVVNGSLILREDIRGGDRVNVGGKVYEALGVPQTLFGDVFIMCKIITEE